MKILINEDDFIESIKFLECILPFKKFKERELAHFFYKSALVTLPQVCLFS